MAVARRLVVEKGVAGIYHCISRCVRRAFLCGDGYDHRRDWIQERLRELAGIFALDVCGYAILSNHFHVVLRVAPARAEQWSADEVAERWLRLFPPPAQLVKMAYDRLGRQTHEFLLADDNDGGYADAKTVTGDIVLEEEQTIYESTSSDDVLLTMVIERHHSDYGSGQTTGPLDTNSDGNALLVTATDLKGRPQITCHWYDQFGRTTATVEYGTNGGSNLNRGSLSSPPTRSDTELRTDFAYNDAGMLESIKDPKLDAADDTPLETRYTYDALGRQTNVVENYKDGTPSGDTDRTTEFAYKNSLLWKMTADLPGTTNQVTEYFYTTTTVDDPGPSKVAANSLLREIRYPDHDPSLNDEHTGRVYFAYNAQGEQIWRMDQAGTVIETDYDEAGRVMHNRVTAFGSACRRRPECAVFRR